MLQALSGGPDTVEADPGWFVVGQASPPAKATSLAPSPDDMPATRVLDEEEKRRHELSRQESSLSPPRKEANGPPPEAASRFVPVAEHELDRAAEERPQPHWWQTGAVAMALVLVGLAVRWSLQAPTADALYARVQARAPDESPGSLKDAESEIREFLDRFPSDSRAAKLRKYEEEIELDRRDRDFERMLSGWSDPKTLLPIQRAYLEAISESRLNPERTVAKLQALVELYEQPKSDTGPTGECITLARRRLARLDKEVQELAASQLGLLEQRLKAADELAPSDPERAAHDVPRGGRTLRGQTLGRRRRPPCPRGAGSEGRAGRQERETVNGEGGGTNAHRSIADRPLVQENCKLGDWSIFRLKDGAMALDCCPKTWTCPPCV